MALADEIIARYSAARLAEWTNPDAPNASSYDATRLSKACTDATAKFLTHVGIAFDVTVAQHVEAAIPGVRAYLLVYLDQDGGEKAIDRWIDNRLKPLARVTARDRLSPTTTSLLQPTVEGGTRVARPNFDNSSFDGITLDNPADGVDDNGLE